MSGSPLTRSTCCGRAAARNGNSRVRYHEDIAGPDDARDTARDAIAQNCSARDALLMALTAGV